MSTPDLASVIDQCLDDLVTGCLTVSECLERYPEHRAELEPLLLAASSLQAVPSRAERAPDRIRRAQFMELIRETPQERRSWVPSLAGLLTAGLFPRVLAAAAPVALAVGIGMFLLVSQPTTPAAASTLTVFAGGAEEQVGGQWRALSDGAAVRQGARVRTTAEGHVLLTFPDGSTSSLEPSTEIAIELLAAGTPRQVQIRQFSGRLWNDVVTDTRAGARYEVLTSDATVQVHGTVFETAVDNGQTSVTTSEGLVDVLVGTERVSVPGGQLVRAQGQRVSERGAAQAAGSLTIDAPFTAALVSERGEATGARTDGAIFRQIRGVTTSNPGDGPQRFEFQRLPPGDYTLVLQRFEQGGGDLVLNVNGVERRVPIDESSGTAQLRVHVDVQDGKPRVALPEDRPRPAPAAERPPVRLVETERTKKLPDVATQRAAVTRREAATTTGPVAAAPASGATRPGGAVPATAQQATPDPQIQRLRDAIFRNDAATIRAVLSEIAAIGDASAARAQFVALVGVIGNDQAAGRIDAALDASDGTLRTTLLERGATLLTADQFERFRRGLSGDVFRPSATATRPTFTATPSPTRTPTPEPTSASGGGGAATPRPTEGPRPPVEPPRRSEITPLPTAVDGFGIRLRIALGSRNDEVIRRALAEAVTDDTSTTRARLAVLADVIEDREMASRVDRALDAPGASALRTRLLRAVESEAPGEVALRALLIETPSPTPSPAPSAAGTSTATPRATATANR